MVRTSVSVLLTLAVAVHVCCAVVELVDVRIGGVGYLLSPVQPFVQLPHAMLSFNPERQDQLEDQIHGFPLSTAGATMFAIQPVPSLSQLTATDSSFDLEHVTPYSYSVRYDQSFIETHFTPSLRAGYFRFKLPNSVGALRLVNANPGQLVPLSANVIAGSESVFGTGNKFKAFLYAEFSNAKIISEDTSTIILAPLAGQEWIDFKYGLSYIDSDQAKVNLQHDIGNKSFDEVKDAGYEIWEKTLSQIKVSGGSEEQRRIFYTALYRSSLRMRSITEVGGRYYSSYDQQVHSDVQPFYVDNGIWDLYRALEPLQILLTPSLEIDMLQSYVRMYEQSGTMPSFGLLQGDVACMNGNHAAAWFADAYFKGIQIDVKSAFAGVAKNSLNATLLPWRNGPKTVLDDFYNEKGWFPSLKLGESETVPEVDGFEQRQPVPVTLENSFDDWCIAQLARVLGDTDDFKLFLNRSLNYRNVFRQDKGMMWPKDADGLWIDPMDPKFDGGAGTRRYYDENNGYTYTWDVQHDYQGLFQLMGGVEQAEANLDQLFRESLGRSKYDFWANLPDSTGMVGQFSMGNEPSFAIPYLFNRMGSPWKSQKRVRMLLESFFTETLVGIPGDEDGGGMSSFVVWSMMGLYPTTPGFPTYDVVSPVFDHIQLTLENGNMFEIVAFNCSADNKYIQSISLNGVPVDQVWIRHADVIKGGQLKLVMGDVPNEKLGSNPKTFPPSSKDVDPHTLM
eukprot:TRINITY_DN1402_c0_g1_i1.p1 TRINITY_DN1402_c0_g1~~TRINITY_DN1402_c0_g1_i1.p1  ORF type:complete len:733 (-),score=172.04 TRINITY_DN1402_c0_g1_i1:128-2326(-)